MLADEGSERQGIRERDQDAWSRLANQHHRTLCQRARLLLPPWEDPEDAVAETWLRALKAARRYDPRRPVLPWLARICANVCLDRLRWLRRHPRASSTRLQEARAREGDAGSTAVERRRLQDALLRLPAKEREVLLLRHLFGVPVREMSVLLGLKRNTVDRRLARGLEHLRQVCLDDGEGSLDEGLALGGAQP